MEVQEAMAEAMIYGITPRRLTLGPVKVGQLFAWIRENPEAMKTIGDPEADEIVRFMGMQVYQSTKPGIAISDE